MTNRLLAVVVAIALSSGIAAHAAQRPTTAAPLAANSSLPISLQTAAAHLGETATGAIDPAAAIRAAYQRDHVALAHLRLQAAGLHGNAYPAFEQYIADQDASLTEIERTALATSHPSAGPAIRALDQVVNAATIRLNQQTGSSAITSW
jgi:hypothetical protein